MSIKSHFIGKIKLFTYLLNSLYRNTGTKYLFVAPGDWVKFVTIPDELKVIVTLEHAYKVEDTDDDRVNLRLDNEYTHWVNEKYL